MKSYVKIGLMAALFCLLLAGTALASHEPDFFIGDTAIYSASTSYLRPNILFIVDNSAGMGQRGTFEAYDPTEDYANLITIAGGAPEYDTWRVYERKAATGGVINYANYITDVRTDVSCAQAKTTLEDNGYYAGKLKRSTGACTGAQEGNYYLGNILNYTDYVPPIPVWQPDTLYDVGAYVYPTAGNEVFDDDGNPTAFQAIADGTSDFTEPAWPTIAGDSVVDGQFTAGKKNITWAYPGAMIDMVETVLGQVTAGARESVNIGLMTLGDNNRGGKMLRPVAGLATVDADGDAKLADLQSDIAALSDNLLPANAQYINEVFWDASLYFKGVYDTDTTRISSGSTVAIDYSSPITKSCQKNFVILLTTGSQDENVMTKNRFGDEDSDGDIGYVDDAAKILYEIDHVTDDPSDENTEGFQRVQTNIVQLMTPQVDRLAEAADSAHGRGNYFKVNNSAELTGKLLDLMNNIVRDADTSFVAPVVPTSPENRTYSGQRVYLGFFNPVSQKPWMGNIKKLGLDTQNQITDKNDVAALNADGSFSAGSVSYWRTDNTPDAGIVEAGGAGELLLFRDIVPSTATDPMSSKTDARDIYTYLGSSTDLKDSSNHFDTDNGALSTTVLDLDLEADPSGERDKLIRFIHGLDSYDNDKDESVGGNGVTNEKRSWILGDILHSKPQVVNYNTYTFTVANESDCSVNEAMIYVGGNDGMLHAFRDCDGQEEWAFVPPEVLGNLKHLRGIDHAYFVDGSPRMYKYDHDNDGNIEQGDGDMVLLYFGLRRGGRAYYALDVTIPDSPVYLWELNDTHLPELAQTWSQPVFGKIKTDDGGTIKAKVVAFVGAGYDNDSEDRRFGSRIQYPVDRTAPIPSSEGGVSSENPAVVTVDPVTGVTSTTYNYPTDYITLRGRGVFAFEIATLDSSGVPTKATTPNVVWQFTRTTATHEDPAGYRISLMRHSFASDVAALDTNFDGYTDRLYVGDTNGWMWRLGSYNEDTSSPDYYRPTASSLIDNWFGAMIVYAWPKKIFFPPSVAFEPGGQINLYYGTGDRAHPLNWSGYDYLIGFKDKGPSKAEKWPPYTYIHDASIYDATYNNLQDSTGTESTDNTNISNILGTLNDPTNRGWKIKLIERAGEKVLADALVFNKVAYYTTYAPNTVASTNPCLPGNLGESRLYAVDYKTGEAVYNFFDGNDTQESTNTNARAGGDGYVLRRDDRSISLGVGIPSGLVMVINASGDPEVLIGCGGGVCNPPVEPGGTLYPVYWLPY